MSWLDDLQRDPDSTHRSLIRSLYGRGRIVAAFAPFPIPSTSDVRTYVAEPAPIVLVPPDACLEDQIAVLFTDGTRIQLDPRRGVRWQHMLAFFMNDNDREEGESE